MVKRTRAKGARRKDSGRAKADNVVHLPKPEQVQMIGERDFAALVRAIRSHEADKNESVGAIGSAVNNAVDKKNLDKKAFGMFRTLARMSDNKLATTLAHLEHYVTIGGLQERADKQREMFARPEVGEQEPEHASAGNGAARGEQAAAPDKEGRGTFSKRLREQQPDIDTPLGNA